MNTHLLDSTLKEIFQLNRKGKVEAITMLIDSIADDKIYEAKAGIETEIECKTYKSKVKLNTLEDWREEDGDCLWWEFPIEEPPYCGNPLDCKFPNYVTHFTKLTIPKEPK